MSYCRWSCMKYMSDLYCYEDVAGGWTTRVASRRNVRAPNAPDPLGEEGLALLKAKEHDKWSALNKAYQAELDDIPMEDIDNVHAGRSYNDPTLEEFLERVRTLRLSGLNVPDWVEPQIIEEISEQ